MFSLDFEQLFNGVFRMLSVCDFDCECLKWNIKLMFLSDANPY